MAKLPPDHKELELELKGQKRIKGIEQDHFPILLEKLKPFSKDLSIEDAFVAGLIAAHDYSIITMVLKKLVNQKKERDNSYWMLYTESTKAYKCKSKPFKDDKKPFYKKEISKIIESQESDVPESLIIPLKATPPVMEKIDPDSPHDRSSSICSDSSILDSTVQNLKSQLNVKKMNQNEAVKELEILEGMKSLQFLDLQVKDNHSKTPVLDNTPLIKKNGKHKILEANEETTTLKMCTIETPSCNTSINLQNNGRKAKIQKIEEDNSLDNAIMRKELSNESRGKRKINRKKKNYKFV
ncbi:unnamed protein product [Moneuplotes crassus]|uniref:Uncharacterized protein n=1 Tax=Euplotes crassus TaxID=5936 RepID=A0AAD2D0A8_EUPCR|nr:unnamed protein product [Moneuplotes crassus]